MIMRWMLIIPLLVLMLRGPDAFSDEPKCKSNPRVVDACFSVRGRLNYWNGTPSTRIWIIGTHRILGLPGEDGDLPNNVKAHLHAFGDEITADYLVCPFAKYRKGEMQMVCVQSATNVQFKHLKEQGWRQIPIALI
jgi:hypothetical protein